MGPLQHFEMCAKRWDHETPHGTRRPTKKNIHLMVIKSGGGLAQIAIRLKVKIASIVFRQIFKQVFASAVKIAKFTLAHAPSDFGRIFPKAHQTDKVASRRGGRKNARWIEASFDILNVFFMELFDGLPKLTKLLSVGEFFAATAGKKRGEDCQRYRFREIKSRAGQ